MLEITIIEFLGIVLAILSFGIAVGKFVEKVESNISKHKNNRHLPK